MIRAGVKQLKTRPVLCIELTWDEELDPDKFARIARELMERWGIWKTVLIWRLRDGAPFDFEIPPPHRQDDPFCEFIDAREVISKPRFVLLRIARSMARTALKYDVTHYLPKQFPKDVIDKIRGIRDSPIVGLDGKPLRVLES